MQGNQQPARSPIHWFITGSTGFIGREFIRSLVNDNNNSDRITVLVRSGRSLDARERFSAALKNILCARQSGRIEVLPGDISTEKFGLDDHGWRAITHCTHLVHLAANTSFTATLSQARKTNLSGARNMLALADACRRNGRLRHWSHVSTAYVAGSRTDTVRAGDLNAGGKFRNFYEQSKSEAEYLLHPYLNDFPLTIFRPSIVIGNSKTGDAGNFNTVYWAIRSYLSGQTKLYARADAPLDLVPVDYVVDAMMALIRHPDAAGKTLHLAAGKQGTIALASFTRQVCQYLDSPMPDILSPVRLKLFYGVLALAKMSAKHRRFIEQAESYLPYFSRNPLFDTDATGRLLAESGIQVPRLQDYLPRILDYCLAQPWGKRSKIVGSGFETRRVANG